ncbi:hypothetical protein RHGRI_005310 [Rhododendron griersonianum]|uniref:Uncharacterized protein n=1 Tax=Rhododendron griersonianum TaxID=479676 RepID=A0AAV6LD10_9ERIC|nr:hypothetical protein RHGRI_005310 [Rhododendron griersonianum]
MFQIFPFLHISLFLSLKKIFLLIPIEVDDVSSACMPDDLRNPGYVVNYHAFAL